MNTRIKKGDNVRIMAGRDRGKEGKVLHVSKDSSRITVEKLNLVKKHARPRRQGEKGQIISISAPLAADKVMPVCGKCKKAVRVGFRVDNNQKVRFCKKCQATI